MWLAGLPVADRAVLELTRRLRENELDATAERLERAYDREARIVALDITDREAILRVLEDCPDDLLGLGPRSSRSAPGGSAKGSASVSRMLRFLRRTLGALRIAATDSRIPKPLRWLAALGLAPIPGPIDEVVLLIVAVPLGLFYREPLREAWKRAEVEPARL